MFKVNLDLNRTPQVVENNSVIFAKNMKLSKDGSYLTQDNGFEQIFPATGDGEKGKIVHLLTTPDKCIAFVIYPENGGSITANEKYKVTFNIYTNNTNEVVRIPTNLKLYSNSQIKTAYSYNYKNELIIAIAESKNDVDIPLRVFNLDELSSTDSEEVFNLNPSVPFCKCKLDDLDFGVTIPNGTYHFYIRYKIKGDNYTKWFPIGAPYYAVNLIKKTFIDHKYPDYHTASTNAGYHSGFGEDLDGNDHASIKTFVNDDTKDANFGYSLKLKLTHLSDYNINNEFQLGYILQHESSAVARSWKSFKINTSNTFKSISYQKNSDYINDDIKIILRLDNNIICNVNIGAFEDIDKISKEVIIPACLRHGINCKTPSSSIAGGFEFIYDKDYYSRLEFEFYYKEDSSYVESDDVFEIESNEDIDVDSYETFILFDAVGVKEISIDDITEKPLDIYNVKSIESYNNRLYIGNYKEYNSNTNIDFSNIHFSFELKTPIITHESIIEGYKWSDTSFTSDPEGEDEIELVPRTPYFDKITSIKYYWVSDGHGSGHFYKYDDQYEQVNLKDLCKNTLHQKTLLPNQKYDFYIHFVKKDGISTNGIYIGSGEQSITTSLLEKELITTNFGISSIPSGYDGFYISYKEHSKQFISEVWNIGLKKDYFGGNVSIPLNINKYGAIELNIDKEYHIDYILPNIFDYDEKSTRGCEGGIIPNDGEPIILFSESNDFTLRNIDRNIIQKAEVDDGELINNLIKLTDVYTLSELPGETPSSSSKVLKDDVSDFNYNGFYTCQQIPLYRFGLYIDVAGVGAYSQEDEGIKYSDNRYIKFILDYKYSRYNLLALSIKKDSIINATNYVSDSEIDGQGSSIKYTEFKTKINLYINPQDSNEIFELKRHYIADNFDTIINYYAGLGTITEFGQSIRRSDVMSDESDELSWRNFRANNYKLISEDKGNITNIVGLGLYLLVHTEHSLFVFNRNNSLKSILNRNSDDKDIQLYLPDTFDIEYQEVFSSKKGFGGLQDPMAYNASENGYMFFDNDSKTIFLYDDNKLDIISAPINEFLINAEPIIGDVKFAYEPNEHRMFIYICHSYTNKQIVLSYNFASKSFISAHNFIFGLASNTKTNCYLSDYNNYTVGETTTLRSCLCRTKNNNYDNWGQSHLYDYKELTFVDYDNADPDLDNPNPVGIYPNVDNKACVDIIYKENYSVDKVLESIKYILNKLNSYTSEQHISQLNVAEQNIEPYSGYKLVIYTDRVHTNLIDIDNNNNINEFNDYKKPYFEKGVWNFNWFRDIKNVIKQPSVSDTEYKFSDEHSLIYGKYIVARFIFDNAYNSRVKFENVLFNVNNY